jgi:spermidine synthase
MRPVLIDTASLPGESGSLGLYRDGEDFVIRIEGGTNVPLMSTRMHGSEDALGKLACERVASRAHTRVLVGGLGMGFTLAASLEALGPRATVVVAELVPGVVEWNRGPLGEKSGMPLLDPRTEVRLVDVAKLIKSEPAGFDAIMLDVDNGPDGLTQRRNGWLYTPAGLQVAHEALRPAGVLAIWSAAADEAFAKRVAKAGFDVEEVQVYAHGKRGTRHTLWFGTKRSRAPGGAKAASPARAGAASPKATAAAAVPRGASRRSR